MRLWVLFGVAEEDPEELFDEPDLEKVSLVFSDGTELLVSL